MQTLVIKSSEWLRGELSHLWNTEKQRGCCLGLCGIQAGLNKVVIQNFGTPAYCDYYYDLNSLAWMVDGEDKLGNSNDAKECIRINDNPKLTDEERITKLKPIFQRNGWEIDWRPNE